MNLALIGSVSSSWHCLRALIRNRLDVRAVCGLHERHAATVSDYRSLRDLADQAHLPFLAFDRLAEPAVHRFLSDHHADLLFAVGISQMVPRRLIDLFPAGAIGFHPTMLPKMRGRAPVAWTILLDEQPAVSLFFLTDQPDAGDIVLQRPVQKRPDDYAADLIARTNQALEACIDQLAPAIRTGNLPAAPQDPALATYLARRSRADGLIDFRQPAERIYRLIRATSRPYPGAFTHHHGRELIVWRARPHPRNDHLGSPGQIVAVDPSCGLLVQTGDGLLWLTELQFAGHSGPARPDNFRPGQRLGLDTPAAIKDLQERISRLE
ncbi:MAG: methionyl-tRNA formyltransferase, partial [Phycisphaerae bacterium]